MFTTLNTKVCVDDRLNKTCLKNDQWYFGGKCHNETDQVAMYKDEVYTRNEVNQMLKIGMVKDPDDESKNVSSTNRTNPSQEYKYYLL